MKVRPVLFAIILSLLLGGVAAAQEHWTEGPVWEVTFYRTLHKNMAALDYSAENDKKAKAIAEKHYKTADEEKQREMAKPRFDWRTHVGTQIIREVTLKPLP